MVEVIVVAAVAAEALVDSVVEALVEVVPAVAGKLTKPNLFMQIRNSYTVEALSQ